MKKLIFLIFPLLFANLHTEGLFDYLKDAAAEKITDEASMFALVRQSTRKRSQRMAHLEEVIEQATELIEKFEEDEEQEENTPTKSICFEDPNIIDSIKTELYRLLLETESNQNISQKEIKDILEQICSLTVEEIISEEEDEQ